MHIKRDYNFFSGQETKKSQSKIQLTVIAIVGILLITGAAFLFLWGRASLTKDMEVIAEVRARLEDPAALIKLQELTQMQAQSENLASYTSLAAIVLERIETAQYVSSAKLDALLASLPASVQVDSLDVQGRTWHLECKTAVLSDIAVTIHNLDANTTFSGVMVGTVMTDESGISTFPLDIQLEGGKDDATE